MQAQADAATIESPASLTQARQLISFIKKHCKSLDNGVLAIFEHFTAADFEAPGNTRFHWVKVLAYFQFCEGMELSYYAWTVYYG